MVQFHIKSWSPPNTWYDQGDWWIWIGFRSSKETAFFSVEPDVSAALIGLRQGTALKFIDGKEAQRRIDGQVVTNRSGQLQLRPNPLGDQEYYSWRKNTQSFVALSTTSTTGFFTRIEIKRVCKGPLQYRTVRLFDDSPVQVCSGLNCYTTRDPREAWIDEARIEAKCNDGKTATFQYGPTGSYHGRPGRSPVMGYFDDWLRDAWQKIPLGVQLK